MTPKAIAAKQARAEQARQSKLAIMRAARDCFSESGYHATSMATIAERAGVAPQTVSYHFGTKTRLTSELVLAIVMFELDPPAEGTREEWVAWMMAAQDAPELLRRFSIGGMVILSRVAAVMAAIRDGAPGDPELAENYRQHEALRREEHRNVTAWLAERGWLRAGLDPEEALDLLTRSPRSRTSSSPTCARRSPRRCRTSASTWARRAGTPSPTRRGAGGPSRRVPSR